MSLVEQGAWIHAWMVKQGFYEREGHPSFCDTQLLFITSEVCEAQRALHADDYSKEAEEVADILIRALDYAAYRGMDMDAAVARKMVANYARPQLHGRAF